VNTFSSFVLKIKCAGQWYARESLNLSSRASAIAEGQVLWSNSWTEGFDVANDSPLTNVRADPCGESWRRSKECTRGMLGSVRIMTPGDLTMIIGTIA
jgi:hypothetical protein